MCFDVDRESSSFPLISLGEDYFLKREKGQCYLRLSDIFPNNQNFLRIEVMGMRVGNRKRIEEEIRERFIGKEFIDKVSVLSGWSMKSPIFIVVILRNSAMFRPC